MQIRTKYVTVDSGAGRIRATVVGMSKQLTVAYDHGSMDPHKDAAWALAQKIEPKALRVQMVRVLPTGYIFRVDV